MTMKTTVYITLSWLLLCAGLAVATQTDEGGHETNENQGDPEHGPDDETKEKIKEHLGHWGYTGAHGVDHWADDYPACGHQRQSPINIEVKKTKLNEDLGNIDLLMPTDMSTGSLDMYNNGHSVSSVVKANVFISGGGLIDEYQVAGFHFHWGSDSQQGSEHTVDGAAFPLEMHIVSFDVEKYATLTEAVKETDALAVLGVLFEISAEDNPRLNPVIEKFSELNIPTDTEKPIATPLIDLRELLPGNTRDYYRYLGSLTTPGCFESVIWTVFKTPQKISENQMEQFRQLYDSAEQVNHMMNNYRPTQPLIGRTVWRSFPTMAASPHDGKDNGLPGNAAGSSTISLTAVVFLAVLSIQALYTV